MLKTSQQEDIFKMLKYMIFWLDFNRSDNY